MSTILCSCVTSDNTIYPKSVILDENQFCNFDCVKCLGTGKLRPIVRVDFPLKEGLKWGVIKWYSTTKQYGFIWLYGLVNSTPDVFFHYSDVTDEKLIGEISHNDLAFQPGDIVSFEMVINDNRLYGANVKYYIEGE